MPKSDGNKNLGLIVVGNMKCLELAKSRRPPSQIDDHIKDGPACHADQFRLGKAAALEMETSNGALTVRKRFVVLDKAALDPERR